MPDEFQVVQGDQLHSFTIEQSSNSNAKATGDERQICYELHNDEANWTLPPSSALGL